MQDDAEQSLPSAPLVESPGFVAQVSGVELGWVLYLAYDLDRISQRTNADLADCLIARSAAAAGRGTTVTFDRGAAEGCRVALLT